MSKFDEFIEAADKDLEVDTSTRVSSGSMTPPTLSSPGGYVSGGSAPRRRDTHAVDGTKTYRQPRQFTPQVLSNQDHPLKDSSVQSLTAPGGSRLVNGLSKRRSLIQPIVAPKTPEARSKFNISAPPTLITDRSSYSGRNRSASNASLRSPAADSDESVSTLLQSLANKELEILDAKQRIEGLKKQLVSEDILYQARLKDLQELKERVSNHFQKATTINSSPTVQNTGTEVKGDEQIVVPQVHRSNSPSKDSHTSINPAGKGKRRSVWSKSLAIFNQFDQIIQHELERSLNWDEQPSPVIQQKRQPDSAEEVRSGKQDEEPAGVTKSLWNFVSDMKDGLLGIDEESDSRQESGPADGNGIHGLGLSGFDSSAVHDNRLKFIGGELGPDEDNATKEVEMKDLRA